MNFIPGGARAQLAALLHIDAGTSARSASSPPGSVTDVSFEIGASFMPVRTRLLGLTDAQMQVLAWLRQNRRSIALAERRFRVDRRAIAGAIAWEMLENVRRWSPRSAGPGKVHLYNWSTTGAFVGFVLGGAGGAVAGAVDLHTVAVEVEELGYLPPQSFASRRLLLATPEGAITYIAAIMAAFADIAAQHGFADIRSDPVTLTNAYQSKTLATWREHLAAKAPGSPFAGGNPMDRWVAGHLPYLEDGVGTPELPESAA